MKLKPEEIKKIAGQVVKSLVEKAHAVPEASLDQIQVRIEEVFVKNLQEEMAIEEGVKKLMEQYRTQIASGAIDSQKMYMMIKKQLAKERKFVL